MIISVPESTLALERELSQLAAAAPDLTARDHFKPAWLATRCGLGTICAQKAGIVWQISSCPVGTCNVRFRTNKIAKTPVKSRFIRFNPQLFSTIILLFSLTVSLTLSVRFSKRWFPKVTTFGAGSGWRKVR
jgi:hypothetical protein